MTGGTERRAESDRFGLARRVVNHAAERLLGVRGRGSDALLVRLISLGGIVSQYHLVLANLWAEQPEEEEGRRRGNRHSTCRRCLLRVCAEGGRGRGAGAGELEVALPTQLIALLT